MLEVPAGFKQPSAWPKRVRAALMEITDDTDEDLCDRIGIAKRTLSRWRQGEHWPEAIRQAEARFQERMVRMARSNVVKAMESEGSGQKVPSAMVMTRFMLERGDRLFRPPPKQDASTEAPVVLGDVPSGFQRNPTPEGTLANDVDPTELMRGLESKKPSSEPDPDDD